MNEYWIAGIAVFALTFLLGVCRAERHYLEGFNEGFSQGVAAGRNARPGEVVEVCPPALDWARPMRRNRQPPKSSCLGQLELTITAQEASK